MPGQALPASIELVWLWQPRNESPYVTLVILLGSLAGVRSLTFNEISCIRGRINMGAIEGWPTFDSRTSIIGNDGGTLRLHRSIPYRLEILSG